MDDLDNYTITALRRELRKRERLTTGNKTTLKLRLKKDIEEQMNQPNAAEFLADVEILTEQDSVNEENANSTERETEQLANESIQQELESVKQELDSIKHEKESLQQEFASMKQELDSTKHDKNLLQQKLESEKESLQQELASMKQALDSTKHDKNLLQQKLESEKESLQQELASVKQALDSTKHDKNLLQQKFESVEREHDSTQRLDLLRDFNMHDYDRLMQRQDQNMSLSPEVRPSTSRVTSTTSRDMSHEFNRRNNYIRFEEPRRRRTGWRNQEYNERGYIPRRERRH